MPVLYCVVSERISKLFELSWIKFDYVSEFEVGWLGWVECLGQNQGKLMRLGKLDSMELDN